MILTAVLRRSALYTGSMRTFAEATCVTLPHFQFQILLPCHLFGCPQRDAHKGGSEGSQSRGYGRRTKALYWKLVGAAGKATEVRGASMLTTTLSFNYGCFRPIAFTMESGYTMELKAKGRTT